MEVEKLEQVKPDKAAVLYQQYLEHKSYSKPIDEEIARVYRLISQGKTVVKALESIVKAGCGDDKFPKLAIARADQKHQRCFMYRDGSAIMAPGTNVRARNVRFDFKPNAFARIGDRPWQAQSIVPMCPIHQRPKRALSNYHVLYEAEWSGIAPFDPFLLRRLGKGDLWLVLAAWDLTEVERAVLSGHM